MGISEHPVKDTSFWLTMLAIMLATFLAALDTSAVSTALPTIINDFGGGEFVWIGSAYTLAGTSFLPLSGHLANIFGRKMVLLMSLFLFSLGSALSGAAQNLNMLIGGRAVQGIGAGGILSLTEIILADLVPLRNRGVYQGMIGIVWSIASVIGPVVGGSFAQRKDWTWRGLFYLNLPLTGISALLCIFFLHLKAPKSSIPDKIAKIDWIGNIIIIGSCTSFLLGLTWGGVHFTWSSVAVVVPIVIGGLGMIAFLIYESLIPTEPMVPWVILSNRTTVSGYLGTALQGLVISAALFYLPVYFQACKDASPLHSGINMLPYSFSIAPFAIVAGATATAMNIYQPQNIIAWCFVIIGMGLQTTLTENSAVHEWVGFQIVAGIGFGLLFTATTFPILAPLPVEHNASALAFFIFVRSLFQAWGVTIGAAVLQNELQSQLPSSFLASLDQGVELAYAIIPQVSFLDQPLKDEVRSAFAKSLIALWQTMTGIAGLGLLSSLIMKALPLQQTTDENWGLHETVEGNIQKD
ncbi:iron permease [Lentinula lateritia]|uniref:Iron permease n=1 Tax=Lentinula aff. lateritia TaxID=2804960 RepID=A0ACC1U0L6_9AGAR|nr:iron permease [Lentinula aff. lateritia]KAJ3848597.1 iron permease [Lentinula lateritia]